MHNLGHASIAGLPICDSPASAQPSAPPKGIVKGDVILGMRDGKAVLVIDNQEVIGPNVPKGEYGHLAAVYNSDTGEATIFGARGSTTQVLANPPKAGTDPLVIGEGLTGRVGHVAVARFNDAATMLAALGGTGGILDLAVWKQQQMSTIAGAQVQLDLNEDAGETRLNTGSAGGVATEIGGTVQTDDETPRRHVLVNGYTIDANYLPQPTYAICQPEDEGNAQWSDVTGEIPTGQIWAWKGDGSKYWVLINNPSTPPITTEDFSIFYRVKLGAQDRYNTVFDKRLDVSPFHGLLTGIQNDNRVQFFLRNDQGTQLACVSTGTVLADGWHSIGCSADRQGMLRIYIDGAFDAETDISTLAGDSIGNNANAAFGYVGSNGGSWQHYQGELADFNVWLGTVLTDNEHDWLHDHASGSQPAAADIVFLLGDGPTNQ